MTEMSEPIDADERSFFSLLSGPPALAVFVVPDFNLVRLCPAMETFFMRSVSSFGRNRASIESVVWPREQWLQYICIAKARQAIPESMGKLPQLMSVKSCRRSCMDLSLLANAAADVRGLFRSIRAFLSCSDDL